MVEERSVSYLYRTEYDCDRLCGARGMKMSESSICSGLIGAVATQLLFVLWNEFVRWREGKTVLAGIVTECEYNISIIDEILSGVVSGGGSFKRLSVDYFRAIQKETVRYKFHEEILAKLSRIIVDMDLFNLECDYIFNGTESSCVYTGILNDEAVCVRKTSESHDIRKTICKARDGVMGSLVALKELAENLKKGKEKSDE